MLTRVLLVDHAGAPSSHGRTTARARGRGATLTVLVVTLAAVVVSALLPEARRTLVPLSSAASATLVLLAVVRGRPALRWPWLVVVVMIASWGLGVLLARDPADVGLTATVGLTVAQACGALLGLHLVLPRRGVRRRGTSVVDLALIALTLALVVAQMVTAAGDAGTRTTTSAVAPTIDVVFLVLLVVYAASRRRVTPAVVMVLAGTYLYLAVDLVGALQGLQTLPAGHPVLVAAVAIGPLLAAGALHPSMERVFDRDEAAEASSPAGALLSLLPLVAVPPALWAVSAITSVRGVPAPVLLVAGTVMGALCLVRASTALRAREVVAGHDPLTGLPNRHGLEAAHARSRWEVTGLLLVDVDEFKSVNDTHGHDVGDAVLLALRDRIVAAVGDEALVARLGGDEFVVLCEADRAEAVARAVLASLRRPVEVGLLHLPTRASVGVATARPAPAQDGGLSVLLTHADVAMYAAKAAGRGTVVTYRPQMRADITRRFTLGNELRVLLEHRDAAAGRLEVHYQVLVELGAVEGAERAVGAEALVRWCHPRLGLLGPGDFLGLVSACGLDAALDEAVLREVVGQIARWRSQGRTVAPISVNLTRASLVREDLVELVLALLVDAGVPPALLHLEITEHERLPDDDQVADRLLALDGAGVLVHLDDYGTGYTSMDYLRRFPVRVLKIDRAVTTTLDEPGGGHGGGRGGPAARGSIVAGLAAMTDALGLDMLAEGVETPRQAALLRATGVRFAQGYLYGRPQPAGEHELSARPAVGPPCPTAGGTADGAASSPASLALPR